MQITTQQTELTSKIISLIGGFYNPEGVLGGSKSLLPLPSGRLHISVRIDYKTPMTDSESNAIKAPQTRNMLVQYLTGALLGVTQIELLTITRLNPLTDLDTGKTYQCDVITLIVRGGDQ